MKKKRGGRPSVAEVDETLESLRDQGIAVDSDEEQQAAEFVNALQFEIRRRLHAALDAQLADPVASQELPLHAVRGRGFKLVIVVTNADGTPWNGEEIKERRIILPHEQQ